jgi:hypothetical protein
LTADSRRIRLASSRVIHRGDLSTGSVVFLSFFTLAKPLGSLTLALHPKIFLVDSQVKYDRIKLLCKMSLWVKRMVDLHSTIPMKELPRSQSKISRDMFVLMANLYTERRWLTESGKAGALTSLLDMAENFELLQRFHFIDQITLQKNLLAIKNQILDAWQLSPSDTIILGSSNRDHSKSSDMILYLLKPLFANSDGWNERLFITTLGAATKLPLVDLNIVMVDDFIGSGTDISKKVNWLRNKLNAAGKRAKIYVCVFAAMQQSKTILDGLCTSYLVTTWLSRGLSDFYEGSALGHATQLMERLESKLCCESFGRRQRLSNFHFGYKRSEALYHLENSNSPNNVFPIFWWDCQKPNIKRQPLFPRL